MDAETISLEIVKTRSRLREIEKQRVQVPDDDLGTKADLRDEEVELQARLAELQDMTTEKGDLSKELATERRGKSRPEDYPAQA